MRAVLDVAESLPHPEGASRSEPTKGARSFCSHKVRLAIDLMELSIVIPVRNEAGNITPLVAEIVAALDPAGVDYEVVYVDDGSTDATAAE
ncbi:MAG: glycosyltransferase, partial [Stellaceae bacterium]